MARAAAAASTRVRMRWESCMTGWLVDAIWLMIGSLSPGALRLLGTSNAGIVGVGRGAPHPGNHVVEYVFRCRELLIEPEGANARIVVVAAEQ